MLQSRIGLKLRTILFSITLFVLLGQILVSIITHDIPGVQAKGDFEQDFRMDPMASLGLDIDEGSPSEIGMENGKRFKLYEKKRLTHDKAKKFCKKREGQLALAKNVDEMRRLQSLLMKARLVGGDIWVGADKKEWKKYSSKMLGRENQLDLGPHAMMLGGGPTEMCPALSSSTRALIPSACYKELPFICEYEPGKGKVKAKAKDKTKTAATAKKESQSQRASKSQPRIKMPTMPRRDEMRRRKREIVKLTETEADSAPAEPKRNAITTQSMYSPSPSTSETGVTLSGMETSTSDLEVRVVDFPPEAGTTENSAAAGAGAHYIGFVPHIVHLRKSNEGSGSGNEGAGANTVKLKLSTKLMLAEEPDIENLDNGISISSGSSSTESTSVHEPTLLANTMQLTSESDPDQAMVDLINEQSELQSLETMLVDVGLNMSVQDASAFTTIDMKSYGHDEMSTLSALEGRSNDSEQNETKTVEDDKSSSKSIPDKRAGKGSSLPTDIASELAGNSPLQQELVTKIEIEESEVTESSTTSHERFEREPSDKNMSQSLLEPTITIELKGREGHDDMPPKHNGNQSSGVVATPSPLLSPMNSSVQNGSKSSESQPGHPRPATKAQTPRTRSTPEMTTPSTRATQDRPTIVSTTRKTMTTTTTAKQSTRPNMVERSATMATVSTPMNSPTQETQGTTSANTPLKPMPTTPSLVEEHAPKVVIMAESASIMANATNFLGLQQLSTANGVAAAEENTSSTPKSLGAPAA